MESLQTATLIVPLEMNELLPLYDAAEMRALDAAAIDLGIPAAVLMERAGLGAAHEIMSRFPDRRRFAIVAGTGNNGGDGFVVARSPADRGAGVRGAADGSGDEAQPRVSSATWRSWNGWACRCTAGRRGRSCDARCAPRRW